VTAWPRQPDRRTCGPSVVVVARGLPGPWPDFEATVLATHRRLNRVWPRALGTTPWAVARALGGRVRWIRGRGWGEVLAALPRPTPVYLGSRWLPRHVVLALDVRDGVPLVYDPARGDLVPVTTCGWKVPWFVIVE
jgi:hypothetical protein